MTAQDAIAAFKDAENPQKATGLSRFFKTGAGQYGEGDVFLGLTVPQTRQLCKQFVGLPLSEIETLLHSKYHECRLAALLILVTRYEKGSVEEQQEIYSLYLNNTKWINNWDLVDSSAGYIVGTYLEHRDKKKLLQLARSKNLWERRIAMIACFKFIVSGHPDPAFPVIEILKNDSHDLIQKAVGWMLREIGKRCSPDLLETWLKHDDQYKTIPRTTLRYAIEHFNPEKRKAYLNGTQ